jgi:hypothetical protein
MREGAVTRLVLARLGPLAIVLGCLVGVARADAPSGLGRDALPAIDRVFVPFQPKQRFGFAGTAGYRLTESQAGEGAHHRPEGTLAAAMAPWPLLAVSLAIDAGYDVHPDAGSGGVSVPRVSLLFWHALHDQLQLGAAATFTTAPSFQFAAPAVTGLALGAWQPSAAFTLSAQAGFRFDATAKAVEEPARLTDGARLTQGFSDFNALPAGLAARTRFGRLELAAELSAEFLVGKGAPKWTLSPLRASAVGRLAITQALSVELLARVGLSARPEYVRLAPLLPVEPRLLLGLGVRMTIGAAAPPPPAASAPATTLLRGTVKDAEGAAVTATLSLRVGAETRDVQTDGDGRFVLAGVPRGSAQLSVTGEGFEPIEQTVQLDQVERALELRVERRVFAAQLRGLVRSFAGAPLAAQVRVSGTSASVNADNSGRFVLELAPGVYQVEIECDGYLTQRRRVRVQQNGVTLLNVELRAHSR